MNLPRFIRIVLAGMALLALSLPASVSACAACFGKSDSPMAQGMNAGVFALLAVITSVLLGIAIFFVYILRRAARMAATAPAAAAAESGTAAPAAPPLQTVSQPTH